MQSTKRPSRKPMASWNFEKHPSLQRKCCFSPWPCSHQLFLSVLNGTFQCWTAFMEGEQHVNTDSANPLCAQSLDSPFRPRSWHCFPPRGVGCRLWCNM
jgi:hypothetical protein